MLSSSALALLLLAAPVASAQTPPPAAQAPAPEPKPTPDGAVIDYYLGIASDSYSRCGFVDAARGYCSDAVRRR